MEQFDPQLQPQSHAPPRPRSGGRGERRYESRHRSAAQTGRRRAARAGLARAASDGKPFRRQHRRAEYPRLVQHRHVLGHALEPRAQGAPGAQRCAMRAAAAHARAAYRAGAAGAIDATIDAASGPAQRLIQGTRTLNNETIDNTLVEHLLFGKTRAGEAA
ncbi:hypothetical protein PSAC2689_180121 [Paraburkholderia sacchari]